MAVKHLFTDEEIRNQLKCLGYSTLPEPYFQKFKADLMKLIEHESDQLSYSSSQTSQSSISDHDRPISRSESSLDSMCYNTCGLKPLQVNPTKYDAEQSSSTSNTLKLLKPQYMDFYMDSRTSGDVVPPRFSKSDNSQKSVEETSPQSCISADHSYNQPAVRIRKTLRKRNGVSQISEETIIPKETDVESICDELQGLSLTPESNDDDCSCENSPLTSKLLRPGGEQCCYSSKSFFRPNLKQELRKDDPVNRFHKYNKIWKGLKVPGQELHKNVCWRVRERMLYPDIPVTEKKSAPSHITNNFSFANIKNPAAWEVRSNLAFGNKKN